MAGISAAAAAVLFISFLSTSVIIAEAAAIDEYEGIPHEFINIPVENATRTKASSATAQVNYRIHLMNHQPDERRDETTCACDSFQTTRLIVLAQVGLNGNEIHKCWRRPRECWLCLKLFPLPRNSSPCLWLNGGECLYRLLYHNFSFNVLLHSSFRCHPLTC